MKVQIKLDRFLYLLSSISSTSTADKKSMQVDYGIYFAIFPDFSFFRKT